MEEYERELTHVRKELRNIEVQLQALLEKQSSLSEKKWELETILKQHAEKDKQVNDDKKWDSKDFAWSKRLDEKMMSVFNISSLRQMQLQTMNVTMSDKDCILIMPTGGGKSLCFQLPALLSIGMSVVVSPLVSLMEDQLMGLEALGVEAAMLNASSTKDHVKSVHNSMTDKNSTLKLLYVTPEKLAKSKNFMNRLEKMHQMGNFSRLVIDEVHCCSQWGHDFRPDYKFLGIMKRQFPHVPILGLTATATSKVLQDVKKILNIAHCLLFKASFNRPNLFYEVRQKPSVMKESMDEIQNLITTRFKSQSGIVYCFSKKDTHDVALELQIRGIKAACYHSDLSAKERSHVHRMWSSDQIHVVVATVAFGMGIDKPNVRFVIHHSLSKSMENLYQESGRAGRDNQVSHCIVYYRLADIFRQSTMVFTEQTGLENLYGIVAYCIDSNKCRRSVIARHFGEIWDSSQCNKMCDHCNRQTNVINKDVTKYSQGVMQILEQASLVQQRVTAIKLLDALYGKGQTTLKVKGLDPMLLSKEKGEIMLAHLLLKDYLKEDFHFTPYSTISYLLPGINADRLRNGGATITLSLETKVQQTIGKTKPKKLVVINRESSIVSPGIAVHIPEQGDNQCLIKRKYVKKRKPVIIDNDEELDTLDFDRDGSYKPARKKLPRRKERETDTVSQTPICINDSDG